MPRLHLITGHRTINREDEPTVYYCGYDADKAMAVRDEVIGRGDVVLIDRWTPDTKQTRYASEENQAKAKKKHIEIVARKAKAAEAESAKRAAAQKKETSDFNAKQKRLADEAEKKRLADEADKKRLADEADKKRLADEAEKKRLADEAEKKRLADEAEKKRLADEAAKAGQSQSNAQEQTQPPTESTAPPQ